MKSYEQICTESRARITEIDPEGLRGDSEGLLVDIREPEEVASGMLPDALCIPRGRLEKLLGNMNLSPDARVTLYCQTGGRSALAADALQSLGYQQVRSL